MDDETSGQGRRAYLKIESKSAISEVMQEKLLSSGCDGIWEISDRVWRAYFDAPGPDLQQSLSGEFPDVSATWEYEEDVDWAARYQDSLSPILIGRRFAVLPSPSMKSPSPERIPLLLTPGAAFGTGEHFTTSSCMRAIEVLDPFPETLFDVGCGSGILAIGAKLLGAKVVVGCDTDHEAVAISRENAGLNGCQIDFFTGGCESASGIFACVVANILAETLVEIMPELCEKVAPSGSLVLSGILWEKGDSVLQAADRLGFSPLELRSDGRWATYSLAR